MTARVIINTVEDLDSYLASYHIYTKNYDDERTLFKSNINDTSIPYNPLRSEFRGLVMDNLSNNILCRHTPPVKYTEELPKPEEIEEVYWAEDGTNLAVYHFEGALSLGTSKAADATTFKWNGYKTMGSMFYEAMMAVAPEDFVERAEFRKVPGTDKLAWNINNNYTVNIGFHHPLMHPGEGEDVMKIWFIGCIHNDTGYEIPLQELGKTHGLEPLTLLPRNKKVELDLSRYDRSITKNKEEAFYGYIVKTKSKSAHTPILFKASNYFGTLATILYGYVPMELNYRNRYIYKVIYHILSNNIYEVEAVIPPGYKKIMDDCLEHIEAISNQVMLHLENKPGISNGGAYDVIISSVLDDIRTNEPDILKNTPHINKIIKNYITNKYTKFMVDLCLRETDSS